MLQRLTLYVITLFTLFSVALLEKGLFALQHSELHQGHDVMDLLTTLLWGFRFDLAVSAILAFLAYLAAQLIALLPRVRFATALRWSTYVTAVLLILLHGADSLYYGEAGRHLGYELKEGLNSGTALALSAITTYLVPVSLQFGIMLLVLPLTGWLFRHQTDPQQQATVRQRSLTAALALLPLLLLTVTLVRGGVQQIPLEPIRAQAIGDSQQATLALNGAYNALYTSIAGQTISPLFAEEPTADELALMSQLLKRPPAAPAGMVERRNVIIVLLESWSGAYMASYGHDLVTTPNFDRLRHEGLTTRAMLAGGSRTTEGMFATFCSAQNPLGMTVAQSQLQNYDYHCLPRVMREQGWSTAFFQGTYKETSGTGSFAQLLGFEKSYGREDIDPASAQYETHPWGYHDPDIYRFALEKVRSLPKPFVIGINTDSTHDHQLPHGYEPILPHDTVAHQYQNILNFADIALGDFITAVRSDPELQDAIIVLVADHSGPTPPPPLQQHLIPFLILAKDIAPMELEIIASQRDIAPTILQILGLTVPDNFSGSSLLQADSQSHFADYYHQGILGWTEGGETIEFPINAPKKMRCYSLREALNNDTPLSCGKNHTAMQKRTQAFTHVSQSLLFSGKLSEVSSLH